MFPATMTALLCVSVILFGMVFDHAKFAFAMRHRDSFQSRKSEGGRPIRPSAESLLAAPALSASALAPALFAFLAAQVLSATVTLCHISS